MAKLEMAIENLDPLRMTPGQYAQNLAKLEGHLVGWTELLQKFIHQAYQQGKTKTDLTKGTSKKRFDASS